MVPLCNQHEASALLLFKDSFSLNNSSESSGYCDMYGEPSYPKTETWKNGTNCCLWDGVSCDTKAGHVIGLDLSCSWLEGQFHPNSTLFHLTHLHTLNLAFNDFFYSPMPSGFGHLVSLTHLNLSCSRFDGVIPSKISHLSKIVSLDLSQVLSPMWSLYTSGMRFEPSSFEKLIVNVTDLRELVLDGLNMSSIKLSSLSLLVNFSSSLDTLILSDTGLQGKLPNIILCLPNLQNLELSWNYNLKGEIPMFNLSTSLRYFDLSFTAFTGKVPNSISHLKSLNYLDFGSSYFEGPILQFLCNLTQLEHLNLGGNTFSGDIPLSLSNLQNLTYLDLSNFNFQGSVSPCVGNITQLNYLSFRSNNFSGEIPSLFSNLQHLIYLDLSYNNFGGLIPDWFDMIRKLEVLYLSGNNLVGQLSPSIFDLQNLTNLKLPSNNLSGLVEFDKFSKLQSLEYLDLSHNSFLSINVENRGDNTFPRLNALFLSSCNIQSYPKFLNRLKYLEFLDLSNNQIHGRC